MPQLLGCRMVRMIIERNNVLGVAISGKTQQARHCLNPLDGVITPHPYGSRPQT